VRYPELAMMCEAWEEQRAGGASRVRVVLTERMLRGTLVDAEIEQALEQSLTEEELAEARRRVGLDLEAQDARCAS
jgi:hypothetical protein